MAARMVVIALLLLSLASCKQDCEQWHENEGRKCVRMTDKFEGNFIGELSVDGGTPTDNIGVTCVGAEWQYDKLVFDDGKWYGILTASKTFTIPAQDYIGSTVDFTGGSGSINGDVLSWSATFSNGTNAAYVGER